MYNVFVRGERETQNEKMASTPKNDLEISFTVFLSYFFYLAICIYVLHAFFLIVIYFFYFRLYFVVKESLEVPWERIGAIVLEASEEEKKILYENNEYKYK